MTAVVVDTDILIDFLRGQAGARRFLESVPERWGIPSCSVISVAEIHAGLRPSETERTQRLLESLLILPVDRGVAELAGRYKREAEKNLRLELDDCLIAATVEVHGALLATRNVRHYPTVSPRILPLEY